MSDTKKAFIAFDGLDGSGKETQTKLLIDHFKSENKEYRYLSFPTYNEAWSKHLVMYLNGEFGSDPETVNAYAASSPDATKGSTAPLSPKVPEKTFATLDDVARWQENAAITRARSLAANPLRLRPRRGRKALHHVPLPEDVNIADEILLRFRIHLQSSDENQLTYLPHNIHL